MGTSLEKHVGSFYTTAKRGKNPRELKHVGALYCRLFPSLRANLGGLRSIINLDPTVLYTTLISIDLITKKDCIYE